MLVKEPFVNRHGQDYRITDSYVSIAMSLIKVTHRVLTVCLLALTASLAPLYDVQAATVTPGSGTRLISQNNDVSAVSSFALRADTGQAIQSIEFCDESCGGSFDSAFLNGNADNMQTLSARNGDGDWQLSIACSSEQSCTLDVRFQSGISGSYPAEIELTTRSTAISASLPGRTGSATLTGIADLALTGSIGFSDQAYTVEENRGLIVPLVRSGGSSGPLSVTFVTSDGSATASEDYTSVSTTVEWADNDSADKIVSIPVLADLLIEDPENFFIQLDMNEGPNGDFSTVTIMDVEPEPRGLVQFDPSSYSISEDGGSVTVTVVREGGTRGNITVGYGTEGGSADENSDFTGTSGTVSWTDGEGGSREIVIPIIMDAEVEDNETFSVFLDEGSVNDESPLGQNTEATITIQNVPPFNSGSVEFSPVAYTVLESAESIEITVVRTGGSDGPVSFTVMSNANGDATDGEDFTGVEQNVTWLDGETGSRTVQIPILMDELNEQDETFQVQLSPNDSDSASAIGNNIEATVTIINVSPDMPGFIQFSIDTYTANETDGTVQLVAQRVNGSDGELGVEYFSEGGTAEAGEDYVEVNGFLSWEDGDVDPQIIMIDILTDDDGNEGTENFFVELSNERRAEVVIIDVPPLAPGIVAFTDRTYTVSETGLSITVTASRTGGNAGTITAVVTTADGTAEAGGDYTQTEQSIVWMDGETGERTVTIPILTDEVVEQNETFLVQLSAVDSEQENLIGNPAEAVITIIDVALASRGFVEFSPVSYTAQESDGQVTITATRQQGSDGDITVVVSTLNGTAVAGSDYSVTNEELSWADNDTSPKSLTIELIDDDTFEPTERFSVRMTSVDESEGESALLGSATTATIDIEELPVIEPVAPGTLQFSASTYSALETDGEVEVVVTRIGGSDGAVEVVVSTSDGTADAGEDYEATQGQLSWVDGELGSKIVSVALNADVLAEPAETFIATLTLPAGQAASTLGVTSEATVTINDVAPPTDAGTVQFTSASVTVSEDDESVALQISRTGGQDGAIAMSVQASNGSATLGEDFQFEPVIVTWADQDDGQRSIVIPIELDNLEESSETFQVSLIANPVNAPALGTPNTVTVTISNVSNPLESGILALAQQNYSVDEAQGTVTIVVNRTDGSDGAVSVQYDTVAGSAQSPEDFTAVTGRLSWEDGDALPKEFTVTVAADIMVEDDEQFEVTLSDPQGSINASLILSAINSIVTIQDSTNIGQLQFASDNFSGFESDGSVVFSVERVGGSDGPVSIGYRLQSVTATESDDYIAVFGTLSWSDGDDTSKTAAIQLLTDSLVEPSETFEIVLVNAQPVGDEQIAQGLATVEIVDTTTFDDDALVLPYVLTIVSGDNQSLVPGDALDPLVLQASLEPATSGSVESVTINWRVQPAGSAELVNGNQTITDVDGFASNQVRVLDRGFVRIIARVGQAVDPQSSVARPITSRIAPPPVNLVEGEIAFTLRAGLFAADSLNNNQAQTGGALDTACVALDLQSDPLSDDPMPLTAAQQDLQATCRILESRLRLNDGTLAAALDRLAPEELFTLGDSVVDTTDLQITNVYSRINAIRSGRTDTVDVSGLNLNIRGELIPGNVVEAAQNSLSSGGSASADEGSGYIPRFGVFANGALSVGEVDGDDNQRSADVSTTGLTLGIDYRLSANSAIGVALGIANNETEFTGDEGRVDLSAVNLSLFATYYKEEVGYVDVVLDAGRNQFDIERRIDLPGAERRIASGNTDANVLALTLGAGLDRNYGAFEFGPYTRVSLVNADVDAYRETADANGVGSGSVLAIDPHSVRSTTVSIGAQVSRTISTRTAIVVPQLRIEAEFELTDRKDGIQATFQHDPTQSAFEVNGNERDTSYVNIGLGSSFLLAKGRSGYVFYETRALHDFVTQHWLKLGLRLEFR